MKAWLCTLTLFCASLHAVTVDEALVVDKAWNNKIYRDEIRPVWLSEQQFWYRVRTGPQATEVVLIDATTGKRKVGADLASLGIPTVLTVKTSLSDEAPQSSRNGPATRITFRNQWKDPVQLFWIDTTGRAKDYGLIKPGDALSQNTSVGHVWRLDDPKQNLVAVVVSKTQELDVLIDGYSRVAEEINARGKSGVGRAPSPDGRWLAEVKSDQLQVTEIATGKTDTVAAPADIPKPVIEGIHWAPDSAKFAVCVAERVSKRQITLVSPHSGNTEKPKTKVIDYIKPGDELPKPQPWIVHVGNGTPQVVQVDRTLFPNPFIQKHHFDFRWTPDSQEVSFDYNQRGHQLYQILSIQARTGAVRVVVQEKSPTFIDYTQKTWRHWLATGELIWTSERTGWCHLDLYDARMGRPKNPITQGAWVVREVLHVDETKRQIWFMMAGGRANEDPYHQHLCRVNLDGKGLTLLTSADGNHRIQFSPDHSYFLDTWSRVNSPPVTELRRSTDGALICVLEKADISALLSTGWQMPDRFSAPGRDGQTIIHGVIFKPSHFDPAKSYPVVEQVYAGPHGSFAPHEFGVYGRQKQMAEMGFIVVQSDGMGTNHRGKKFHDVAWKNLKDAGFPDRIAWIQAAAKERPWMDLNRIGIYGGSAGGQSAMRALLDHSAFYKVAVADCGCHDNRMDKIWWNEQWMGWPVDESYERSSNKVDAAKLLRPLLLIVGEMDSNVDPASTYEVVKALQEAQKPFDYLPLVDTGHSAAETLQGSRARMEFLVKHLNPSSN